MQSAAIRNAGSKRALANTIGERDGVVIQRANQADFTDEAWREVQSLQHNANGETISNAASGRKIHRGFKVGTQDRILGAGRTTGKYGFVDSIDYVNKVIYMPLEKKNVVYIDFKKDAQEYLETNFQKGSRPRRLK